MTEQTQRNAICHLLLRGTRWRPVSVNRKLGPNDRCAPGGAVSNGRLRHDTVALANERLRTLIVRRSALKPIGKFWSGKVGGSGACV